MRLIVRKICFYGMLTSVVVFHITHCFIYPILNVTKFEVTFHLTFCVVKILFLIQGFSLHKSCKENNFPYFWSKQNKECEALDETNLTFVVLVYEIVCFSCLLYSNTCKNKNYQFVLNYSDTFRC